MAAVMTNVIVHMI